MFKFSKPTLLVELTLILIIKIVFIYMIWISFFSHPLKKSMTKMDLGNTLFGKTTHSGNPNPDNSREKGGSRDR